jgi:hypothetical protein
VSLVEQWNEVENGLDPRWSDVRLSLRIEDPQARGRAAALLGPAGPGLAGNEIRFYATRRGDGIGPEAVRKFLRRIDGEGIAGTLTLVSSDAAPPEPSVSRPTASAEWEAALGVLPSDWSDLLCELELASSADLDRAAVLVGPLNPIQGTGRPGFRFRAARMRGYGASSGMVRRCLERLDDEGIGAEVRVLEALSDSRPVYTQGPVWFADGKHQ